MISDIFPTIYLVALFQLVFGIGFDQLVMWAHEHHLWHVAVSVGIGVMMTVGIFVGFFFEKHLPGWLFGLGLLASFVFSGIPMAAGSMRRDVKDKKKKRPLGNTAARIRDEVVGELSKMAGELAEQIKEDTLSIRDLPHVIDKLHRLKSLLKLM